MAKKTVIKDDKGNKKIKIEKPKPKVKVRKKDPKQETRSSKKVITIATSKQKKPETAPTNQKFRITWDKVVNTVNDDSGSASELKVFVRILAFDGKGKIIMDEGKKNKAILEWEKLPSASHQIIPKPWTFTEGSEKIHWNWLKIKVGQQINGWNLKSLQKKQKPNLELGLMLLSLIPRLIQFF